MDLQEMSGLFDLLWNNIASNQAPGLNEYEKSVFLTLAEKQLVKEYFNSRIDAVGGGFDGSIKRQYDFSSIILTEDLVEIPKTVSLPTIDRRSRVFLFPEKYFLSVNEILSDDVYQYSVLPIDYEEYQRLMLKPYSLPIKRGAWRLITGKTRVLRKVQVVVVDAMPEEIPFRAYGNYTTNDGTVVPYSVDVSLQETSKGIVEFHTITVVSTSTINKEDVVAVYTEKSNKRFKGGNKASNEAGDYTFDTTTTTTPSTPSIPVSTTPNNGSIPTDTIPKDDTIDGQESSSESEDYVTIIAPMVEIIGKFTGDLHYRMRYVRNLEPIILDDLTNFGEGLEIDGETQKTICKLPDECHEEIVERAVTLAKIAWQGGTLTQAQQASKSKED